MSFVVPLTLQFIGAARRCIVQVYLKVHGE